MSETTELVKRLEVVHDHLRASGDERDYEHLRDADYELAARVKEAADRLEALQAQVGRVTKDAERISEVREEGPGFWRTCSGCYETSDGYDMGHYPFSDVFACKVGGGCNECGGLGVYWDATDYSDVGEAQLPPLSKPSEGGACELDGKGELQAFTTMGVRWVREDASPSVSVEELARVLSNAWHGPQTERWGDYGRFGVLAQAVLSHLRLNSHAGDGVADNEGGNGHKG